MESFYQIVRIAHIVAGMTAFFVAPVALIARKGSRTHILWGRIFFWGMVFVAASAFLMSTLKPNPFLFLVAVFSFHLSLSGYRAIARRKEKDQVLSKQIDFSIAIIMVLFYLGLAGWGVQLFTLHPHHPFGYISLVFAFIGLSFSTAEIKSFFTPSSDRMAWWYRHMNGMVGSYIAAVSAFSAVNFVFLPDVLRWLWPTLIGTPLLSLWIRHYRSKFNKPVTV